MASAMGILKWPPDTFRRATFYEYTAAMKGHLISTGAKIVEPLSRDEFLDLVDEESHAM
jgi:hypothetical protein